MCKFETNLKGVFKPRLKIVILNNFKHTRNGFVMVNCRMFQPGLLF